MALALFGGIDRSRLRQPSRVGDCYIEAARNPTASQSEVVDFMGSIATDSRPELDMPDLYK